MTLAIAVNPESVQLHSDGTVTGIAYWEIDGFVFPATDWNDFVLVLLECWSGAMIRILKGETAAEILHFMDGPFSIVVVAEKGRFRLEFVDRVKRIEKNVIAFVTRDEDELRHAIVHSVNSLYGCCLSLGVTEENLCRLREASKALEIIE
jgi:hypothetical protein